MLFLPRSLLMEHSPTVASARAATLLSGAPTMPPLLPVSHPNHGRGGRRPLRRVAAFSRGATQGPEVADTRTPDDSSSPVLDLTTIRSRSPSPARTRSPLRHGSSLSTPWRSPDHQPASPVRPYGGSIISSPTWSPEYPDISAVRISSPHPLSPAQLPMAWAPAAASRSRIGLTFDAAGALLLADVVEESLHGAADWAAALSVYLRSMAVNLPVDL